MGNRFADGAAVGHTRLENLQLIVSGLANGWVYGLIALGFVLIYEAAEQVDFAPGDLMMLGAVVAVGLANEAYLGLPFRLACIGAIGALAATGWLLERAILRHVFGQSQVAVVILTIAIGFILRFVAGAIWGHEPRVLESPIAGVNRTLGVAMQASSQNQLAVYYMGIPVKRIHGLAWALERTGRDLTVSAGDGRRVSLRAAGNGNAPPRPAGRGPTARPPSARWRRAAPGG